MKRANVLANIALVLTCPFCVAQQLAMNPSADAGTNAMPTLTSAGTVATTAVANPPVERSLTARWLDLTNFSHAERYRNAYALGGVRDFDNAQARSLVEGRFKFDAQGRYAVGFRASSGRYFNWAFSNYTGTSFIERATSPQFIQAEFTPAEQQEEGNAYFSDPTGAAVLAFGIQSNGWEFYMRELYMSATPAKPVTVEFGSFGIERGYSTEITTFDDDGYLSGERIRLHDPRHLFVDEVAFTNAYFGDFNVVNLFDRGSSLKNFNYRQVSAKKRLNEHVAFSGEYTWQTGISTLREAAMFDVKGAKIVDRVRLEVYERVNAKTFAGAAASPFGPIAPITAPGGAGFAVAAEKKLGRLDGDAGFASVDQNYSVYANSRFFHAVTFTLNGDTYGAGNRPFIHASFKINPTVSAFGYYTHEVGSQRVVTLNQQGLNAGLNFDLKALLNTQKQVF